MLARIVEAGIALEVSPLSNVSLGVFPSPAAVPLRALADAGADIALAADDPLLNHARLVDQYEVARASGFTDPELAALAKASIRASFAPDADKRAWAADVDAWLEG